MLYYNPSLRDYARPVDLAIMKYESKKMTQTWACDLYDVAFDIDTEAAMSL